MNDLKNNWLDLKKRYIGLDIFRVIAIIAICAFHTTIHLGANYGPLQSMSRMGAVFMTAFFMLSGYSLFINYSSKNIIQLQNLKLFFLKRITGIIPMYYISALFFILLHYYGETYKILELGEYSILNELILFPVEILGIQSNFHSIFRYSHNSGTWFISCILICYLVYPLLQEVAKQISNKTKIKFIFLLIFILFYAPFVQLKFQTVTIYANPFFRILEFSIGVILASMKPKFDEIDFIRKYIYNIGSIILINILMIVGVSIAVHLNIYVSNYMLYSLICLSCFIVMLIGFSGIESNVLSKSKIIQYCSKIGYVFFLAQLYSNAICKTLIVKLNITNNLLIILFGWTVCIIISVMSYEIFEKPIKKILNKNIINVN